jgi:dTDP-glucose pyrophosphorylase
MTSFVGVLFCGGRGTRLGSITDYVSKALVPVYDRPAFMYGLAQLRESEKIEDIIVLSNSENDQALRRTGLPTLVQDDSLVVDMFSGLEFIRTETGDSRPAVVMPCDNISAIRVDDTIEEFSLAGADLTITLRRIDDRRVLSQMGVFDQETRTMEYRPKHPRSSYGVLAPYVIRPDLDLSGGDEAVVNRSRVSWRVYDGFWFDIGTPDQLVAATSFLHRHRQS